MLGDALDRPMRTVLDVRDDRCLPPTGATERSWGSDAAPGVRRTLSEDRVPLRRAAHPRPRARAVGAERGEGCVILDEHNYWPEDVIRISATDGHSDDSRCTGRRMRSTPTICPLPLEHEAKTPFAALLAGGYAMKLATLHLDDHVVIPGGRQLGDMTNELRSDAFRSVDGWDIHESAAGRVLARSAVDDGTRDHRRLRLQLHDAAGGAAHRHQG